LRIRSLVDGNIRQGLTILIISSAKPGGMRPAVQDEKIILKAIFQIWRGG
jgi:hypothetical protein